MPKQEKLTVNGEVIDKLPAGNYRVRPRDMDVDVICKAKGKMRIKHIGIIEWDWVKLEINPYDMNKGTIIYRYSPTDVRKILAGEDIEQ